MYKSKQYTDQFTSLDFHIISGGFRCLPNGKLTTVSRPGKFLKIGIFPDESHSPHRGTEAGCFQIS